MTVINAILPYFGGKRTLAPLIVEEFGKHAAYYEPFCGSMAVVINKPISSHETVNDLYGDLINLARVIQDPKAGAALHRRLRRVIMHEQLFEDAKSALLNAEDPVDRAFCTFVQGWMGRNGVSGTSQHNITLSRRWTPNGGHSGTRFWSAVESIPAWRRRLHRVCITQMDAFEFLESIDDCKQSVIYCDPPYIEKGATYVHDFQPSDHDRLADLLHRFKQTRVVVSYYEHPRLAELYPTWTKRNVYQTKAMVSQGQRGKTGEAAVAPEVLLINGPSFVETGGLFS